MALINVPITDNFDTWRQKTNLLAEKQGDLDLLETTNKNSLVESINDVISNTEVERRSILVRAIAMS
jgi:hypothetical protein